MVLDCTRLGYFSETHLLDHVLYHLDHVQLISSLKGSEV